MKAPLRIFLLALACEIWFHYHPHHFSVTLSADLHPVVPFLRNILYNDRLTYKAIRLGKAKDIRMNGESIS